MMAWWSRSRSRRNGQHWAGVSGRRRMSQGVHGMYVVERTRARTMKVGGGMDMEGQGQGRRGETSEDVGVAKSYHLQRGGEGKCNATCGQEKCNYNL